MRVAVIGAGLSGLCCLKHLTSSFTNQPFTVQGFEQTNDIGGTWVYTDKTGLDEDTGLPIHSSMYKYLRTNLPKQVMCFQDFPFDDSLPTFVHHSDVVHYLKQYADHHQLHQYIRFNTKVTIVTPLSTGTLIAGRPVCQWEIEVLNLLSGEKKKEQFDIVLVCNGHFSKPFFDIQGLDNFKGKVLHSHNYRIPETFTGQSVLIVGSGASGIDICLEVARCADKVILSCSSKESIVTRFKESFPKNISEVGRVKSIAENGFIELHSKETINGDDIDSIILCTGYDYDFPFLTPECGIRLTNNRVQPLYKHTINAKHPSMAFIGVNFKIVPSLVSEAQIKYYKTFLLGQTILPCQAIMEEEGDNDYYQRLRNGFNVRYAHSLDGELMWNYLEDLASLGKFDGVKPVVKALYEEVRKERQTNIHYKDIELVVIDELQWKRL